MLVSDVPREAGFDVGSQEDGDDLGRLHARDGVTNHLHEGVPHYGCVAVDWGASVVLHVEHRFWLVPLPLEGLIGAQEVGAVDAAGARGVHLRVGRAVVDNADLSRKI